MFFSGRCHSVTTAISRQFPNDMQQWDKYIGTESWTNGSSHYQGTDKELGWCTQSGEVCVTALAVCGTYPLIIETVSYIAAILILFFLNLNMLLLNILCTFLIAFLYILRCMLWDTLQPEGKRDSLLSFPIKCQCHGSSP